jgi:hypothetical protein
LEAPSEALVNVVLTFGSIKIGEFLDQENIYHVLKDSTTRYAYFLNGRTRKMNNLNSYYLEIGLR